MKTFFSFLINRNQTSKIGSILLSWSLPPNKKKNERTLIKYLKTFQAQFLHFVKTYLIVKPVQGQGFAGNLEVRNGRNLFPFLLSRSTTPAWGGEAVAQCQARGIF